MQVNSFRVAPSFQTNRNKHPVNTQQLTFGQGSQEKDPKAAYMERFFADHALLRGPFGKGFVLKERLLTSLATTLEDTEVKPTDMLDYMVNEGYMREGKVGFCWRQTGIFMTPEGAQKSIELNPERTKRLQLP